MNQEIKARWVAALRSGEFEQGKDYLCEDGKYCCLGVLSELAVRDGVIAPAEAIDVPSGGTIPGLAFDGERHHLPQSVAKWADINPEYDDWEGDVVYDPDPYVLFGDRDQTVSELNDKGMTFPELADLIEEKL